MNTPLLLTTRRPRRTYLHRALSIRPAALLQYWALDERNGTTLRSLVTSNPLPATASAGTLLGEPGMGDGLPSAKFASSYATFDHTALTGFNALEGTLSLWFRFLDLATIQATGNRVMVDYGDSSANAVFANKQGANTLQVRINGAGTGRSIQINNFADTGWNQLSFAWSATGAASYCWLNGVRRKENGGTPVAWDATSPPDRGRIGSYSNTLQFWAGWLQHIGLWNAPLRSAEHALLAGRQRHIVFLGDSHTVGFMDDAANPFYYQVMAALPKRYAGAMTTAVVGQRLDQMISLFPTEAAPQYDPRVSNIVFIWGGHNDLASGGQPASVVSQRIRDLAALARGGGFRVIVSTLTPADTVPDAERLTVNADLRANWWTFADGLSDFGASTTIGATGAYTNTTYFQADQRHLSLVGDAEAVAIAAPAILSLR